MLKNYNSKTNNHCGLLLVVNEHLDTPDSVVDHPRVVEPEDERGWFSDVLHNAHLSNNCFRKISFKTSKPAESFKKLKCTPT